MISKRWGGGAVRYMLSTCDVCDIFPYIQVTSPLDAKKNDQICTCFPGGGDLISTMPVCVCPK